MNIGLRYFIIYASIQALLHSKARCQNQRPIFEKTTYIAEIKEEQARGFPVIQARASVIDGSSTTYRLDSSVNLFAINYSTGWISVAGRLDREVSDNQRFYAYAKNNANNIESRVDVVVHLSDINDNAPQLNNLPATIKLRENADIGTVFFIVLATDADTSRNALLTYSIAGGNQENKFNIDSYSGKISTMSRLDFESTNEFNISLKVQDSGQNISLSNSSVLRIQIQDHDDQPAKFVQPKYFATVPENSPKGYLVTSVKAVDMDTAINAPTEYFIDQDSNTGNAFSIEKSTGAIRINNTLDRESIEKYSLRVKALSTIFNPDYVTVEITVSDSNDNGPIFLKNRYDASISESAKTGTTVLRVAAQDKDMGTNSEFGYAIVGGDAKFSVSSRGDIYLDGVLDREATRLYQLAIVAFETKTAERYDSSTRVYITVVDANDNFPEFQRPLYTLHVTENSPIGTSITQIKATDKDSGTNAEISYSLEDDNSAYIPFKINSKTGDFIASGIIDRERISSYKLKVYAANIRSNIVLTSNATIHVIIDDQNDNSPIFKLQQHDFEIPEKAAADFFVFNFTASDADSGINGNVSYSIILGDKSKFKIDRKSGELRTRVVLDREEQSLHRLTILAKDGSGKNSTTGIVIRVLDINDNAPQFSSQIGYEFAVMEGIANSFVGQVQATDRDSGQNSNVSYILSQGQENFAINSATGVVTSKGILDFETKSLYHLTVLASDNGTPKLRSSSRVKVAVLDTNDHKPEFSRRSYYFNVTENAQNSAIGVLTATDKDAGLNAALNFRIVSGNENSEFSINSTTGILSTAKRLDREMMDLHVLIVSVTDLNGQGRGLEDLAAIQIRVLDENDNSPLFEKTSISADIEEAAAVGSVIANFHAEDADTKQNKQIQYKINGGNTNERFGIDLNSGAVTIRKSIERDQPNNEHSFEISISANDMGNPPRSSLAKLYVTVKDSNDNRPLFYPAQSSVSLKENTPAGSVIFTPNCTDKDSGNNGRMSFRLIQGAEQGFNVDPLTGAVITRNVFDYDKGVQSYDLQIEASDFGNPSLKSTSKVTVTITNVNDNSPQFTSSGPFRLNEGNYTGRRHPVGQIKAFDDDLGPSNSVFGLISYSFINMSSYYFDYLWLFKALASKTTTSDSKRNATATLFGAQLVLDSAMGSVIKLSGFPNYILIGDFKDDCVSNPTLCSNGLSVAMWIKFEAGGYVLSSGAQSNHATGFSLNFESGRFKLRLATNTKEYGLNINSSPTDWYHFAFTWDAKTGLAYYENGVLSTKAYTVTAVARIADAYTKLMLGCPNDADGYPQLFGRLFVGELIIWKSKLQDYEVLHAYRNSERKTGISMPQNAGNIPGKFQLDSQTGEMFTSVDIDREVSSSFKLDVKASDNDPIEPKQNYTQIEIQIIDINDNAPKFEHDLYNLKLQENIEVNSEIITLKATDEDAGSNGRVTYSIAFGNSGNGFSIDANTGKLRNNGVINREIISSYTLQIAASDGGSPPRTTTTILNIAILDANDEYPTFPQKQYTGTVKENLAAGQFVIQVVATDKDMGLNGTISYNISSDYFSIDLKNGRITTKQSLDRENISKHTVVVTAMDGGNPPKHSAVPVIIDVLDENDNSPIFEKSSYYAVITENRKVGSSLIKISAKDSDSGVNGEIKFGITGENGIFKINSKTGLITTADNIDREKFPSGFNIIVSCTDAGAVPRSASVNLFVNISDANDNAPMFAKFSYRGKVIENEVGVVAIVVNATDADTGLAGEIQYKITGGNAEGAFEIDRHGQITTVKGLDRERKAVYELIIRAIDRGGDPRSAEVEADIEVLDANDNAPVIGELPNDILISEATLVGSQVVTVTASDKDTGANGLFSFYGRPSDGKFKIDAKSGAVQTAAVFDFEQKSRYSFVVGVIDSGSPRLNSTTVTINFTIVDSNDNNPVFNPSSYVAHVQENSAVGTPVVKVNASESDKSSAIGYYITNGNQGRKFKIDNISGAISVDGKLNCEEVSIYYLLITASDNGLPPRLGHAYVTVSVMDENDLPPKFQFKDYKSEVKENSAIGSSVLTITATDPDLSNTTKLQFQIAEGNDGEAFSITSYQLMSEFKATIRTAGSLDREILALYKLKIVVSDGIFTDSVNVTIKVTDVNDNYPVFNSSIYQAQAFENEKAGKLVVQISATDADENTIIRYGIENSNGMLFIDRFSGEITTTTKTLDREAAQIYDILCSAQDSGGRKGYTIVRITVLDTNDMKPVFDPVIYEFEIQEGVGSSGKTIATVKATDADDGLNAKILYRIKSGNVGNAFDIHPETGVISSRKEVDREQSGLKIDNKFRAVYELVVEAIDQGNPSLTSAVPAKVNVYLTDINDNPPAFPVNGFSVFISEGALANQNVIAATAIDVDAGNNSRLNYEIIDGNQEGDFSINVANGMIMTAKKLERQKKFAYNFTVKVNDAGIPILTSQTRVRIIIGDTNDNAPVFKENNYSIKVSESMLLNSVIMNISATDADTGQNAAVNYEIVGGNEDGKFAIENKADFASLIVIGSIDREMKDSYEVSIMAKDGGIPYSRMAITYVTVKVIDENDNPPKFSQRTYTGTVDENVPKNTPITMNVVIQATDADVGKNAALSFSIEGLDSIAFTIDSFGILRTALMSDGPIDYEKKTRYDFMVKVTDRLGVGLTTAANVTVSVRDLNDNSPAFSMITYTANIPESTPIGYSVIGLNASDPDSSHYGSVGFQIVSGSDGKFFIVASSGVIKTQGYLDRESKGLFTMNVSAHDGGLPPNIAYCTVIVSISDVNDNLPHFERSNYEVAITETVPVGSYITRVKATDEDLGEAGRIIYNLDSHTFDIENTTGVIRSGGKLDREKIDHYSILVIAKDGDGQTSNASLVIRVLDANDNAPKFLSSGTMIIDVFEKTPNGSIIAVAGAIDEDVGKNSEVQYSLSGGNIDFLAIDNKTGIIRLASALDVGQLLKKGQLVNGTWVVVNITASDSGEPQLSSRLTLQINIIDINEENPSFNSTIYEVDLMENVPIGTLVFKMEAKKNSVNNRLSYSFATQQDGFFNINKNSGVITTAKNINRENNSRFILNVKANDNELPPRFGYSTVIITVLDKNDNKPIFEVQLYKIQVSEDTKVGDNFYTVKATDADAGKNSLINYKLTHANIGTKGRMIELGTICIDALGMESQRIAASQIISSTTLLEQNKDYSPTQGRLNNVQYLKSGIQYQGAWCSGIPNKMQFLQIDLGKLKVVTKVAIQGSPQDNNFVTSFRIFYSNDAESWKNTSQVYAGVSNIVTTSVQEIIPEIRARYVRINPLSWNNRICLRAELYGCESEDAEIVRVPFQVNPRSGMMTVTEEIDRERKETYRVTIQASDAGIPSLNATSSLGITIVDANDNAPRFTTAVYHSEIPENSLPGTEVAHVAANDSDIGKNRELTYQLANGFSKFIIEPSSGVVRVSGHLNYENTLERQYKIQIIAMDSGVSPLSGTALLIVNVTDMNDNPPSFNQTEFFTTIFEGISGGHVFSIITATDQDEGSNAKIEYQVIEGADFFTVENTTGALSCLKEIDRERNSNFRITLMAKDDGKPAQHSTVKVFISVYDVNDNRPRFKQGKYIRTVSEGTNKGSVLATVAATDVDAGFNAMLNYSMFPANNTETFSINAQTGEITLVKSLDREKQSSIKFQVLVQDNGHPSLNDTAEVILFISDENDNSPMILPDVITIEIKEAVPSNTFVIKINATDKDEGANAEMKFSLVHGAHDVFTIDQSAGIITTSGTLDREKTDHYSVVVMASDKGVTPLHGFATVRINIIDANDNSPVFLEDVSLLTIAENLPSGTPIGQVKAIDRDIGTNAYIEYFLSGENLQMFAIDRAIGLVTSLASFDREAKEYYNITVNASNTKAETTQSTIKSFPIRILDANDNAPYLVTSSLTGSVREDASIGTTVLELQGNDLDVGINAKLAFNILYGQGDEFSDFLTINSQNGIITTRLSIINREIRNVTIVVEVSDLGIPHQLNSTANVVIFISDVNDNVPQFKGKRMRASVSEATVNGTLVAFLEAFDKDEGSNAQNVFGILSGNEKGHFRIDSMTGAILSNSSLDRESIPNYHFNVSVRNTLEIYKNSGEPKSSTAILQIQVTDINDNAPVFTRNVFTGGIPSGAKVSTYIMDIKAIDADASKHASLSYVFVNGNQEGNFRIDAVTGKIFSMKSLVGKSGYRYEIAVSASDNDGVPPFNSVSNLTTARIFVLKESQRVWLVLGVTSRYVEERKENLIRFLSNITQSRVYLESVLDVKTPDGTSRSEIVFHAVDESLGVVFEADFIIKKIEANLGYYQDEYSAWKIKNVTPVTSKQTASEEMETYVVVIIVVGAILGLLTIFAIVMFIRIRRTGFLSKVSDDDPLSQFSKSSRNRKRRAKHFSDDTLGWINQYGDWWKHDTHGISKRSIKKGPSDEDYNERKIGLLKQGILSKRNHSLVADENEKRYGSRHVISNMNEKLGSDDSETSSTKPKRNSSSGEATDAAKPESGYDEVTTL